MPTAAKGMPASSTMPPKPMIHCNNCSKEFHSLRKANESDCPFCGSTALIDSMMHFYEPSTYKPIISEPMKVQALGDVDRIKRQQQMMSEMKGAEEELHSIQKSKQCGNSPKRAQQATAKGYRNRRK